MATASAPRRKPKSRVGTPGPHKPGGGRPPGDRLSKEHAVLSSEEAMDEIFGREGDDLPTPELPARGGSSNSLVKLAGARLPNPADPQSALSHFTVLEQWFLRLVAKGRTKMDARRFLKLSQDEVKAINENPAVDEAIAELVEQEITNVVGLMAPLVPKAIQVLAAALNTDDPSPTAIKAADSVLDRALGKAPLMERKEIKQALLIQIQHIDANPTED